MTGASSGIGRELARRLAGDGYQVGLMARRVELLRELAEELPNQGFARVLDVAKAEEARDRLRALIGEMGGVDLVVLSAGMSPRDPDWGLERDTLEVNVLGFAATARVAIDHFIERGSGHLVGLSSIAALRAIGTSPVYSASKAFVSRYLEGLRFTVDGLGLDIAVTDVKPGYVESPMTEGREGLFWIAPLDEAARQIHSAIRRRKRTVYVTRRWRLMAWVMKHTPYPVARWLGS